MANNTVQLKQGDAFYNPNTGANEGTVQFDAMTGKKLGTGGTTSITLPGTAATSAVAKSNMAPGGFINASALGTQAKPLPSPINNTSAQMNLGTQTTAFTEGIAGSQKLQEEESAAQEAITPKNSRQGILDKISSLLGVQSTQGEETQKIFEGEGVQAKKDAVRQLEDKALATDRAYTKQAEKIRANADGKLAGAVNADLAELDRKRNSELADLAIQQKVAQGNYQSAFEIADAKVKAQFEPIENQIKSLTNLYQLYADDMTESEKMLAQEKLQEKRDALDFERQKELISYKSKIDMAERAQVQAMKVQELINQGSLDPKVLNTNQYKAIEALAPAYRAIENYKAAVQKWGSGEKLNGKGAGELQSAYGDALSAWKTLAGLGALSGADFGLAENVIPEPRILARDKKVIAQLDGNLNRAASQANFLGSSLKRAYPNSSFGIDETIMQATGRDSGANDPLGLGLGMGEDDFESNPLGI